MTWPRELQMLSDLYDPCRRILTPYRTKVQREMGLAIVPTPSIIDCRSMWSKNQFLTEFATLRPSEWGDSSFFPYPLFRLSILCRRGQSKWFLRCCRFHFPALLFFRLQIPRRSFAKHLRTASPCCQAWSLNYIPPFLCQAAIVLQTQGLSLGAKRKPAHRRTAE